MQKQILSKRGRAVLATVVDVKGSSYRLPGAKMLITETGETFGTVSGGCLEADVLERAKQVLQTNESQIFVYDTTSAEDSVFTLNMGCRGVVRVLLEPTQHSDYLNFVEKCFESRQSGVVATLIRTNGATNLAVGARLFVGQNNVRGNDFAVELEESVFADATTVLATGRSRCETYTISKVAFEFFLEAITPPLSLIVFGAGADAIPLVDLADNLGWRVAVVDHRAAFATKERFPNAGEIVVTRSENPDLKFDENTAAVVMTHNYEHDKRILSFLLKSAACYIGALGPKQRTENILRELNENFTQSQLDKLYAPVGLDIGADTPETIALSIVAEINSVLASRTGGFLRNRAGSIYNRNF